MATIEKRQTRDGTAYRVKVRLRGEKPRTRTFWRLTDAKHWAAKAESDLAHGLFVPETADRRRTLADLIDRFERDHLPTKARNLNAVRVKQHLAWWRAEYGHVGLDRLKPAIIAEARGKLAQRRTRKGEPLSGATVNRYLASVSAVTKWAWKELGWLPSNPVLAVSKAPESTGIVRFLSDDERKRLLAACRADRDPNIEVCVQLALATGLRQSNIRFLQWDDVDFATWTLAIRETKNGTPRYVPVVGAAQRALQAHYDRDPNRQGWVFKGWRNGAPWSLTCAWYRVRAKAGLGDVRFHDLRHTTASYLTQQGVGIAQVADALGHKTLAMAKRYSHQNAEHVRATLETIAGKLE